VFPSCVLALDTLKGNEFPVDCDWKLSMCMNQLCAACGPGETAGAVCKTIPAGTDANGNKTPEKEECTSAGGCIDKDATVGQFCPDICAYKKVQKDAAAAGKAAQMHAPPPAPPINGGVPLYNPAGILKGRSVRFLPAPLPATPGIRHDEAAPTSMEWQAHASEHATPPQGRDLARPAVQGLPQGPRPRPDLGRGRRPHGRASEKLGRLQPFIAAFPQECLGQLASFGPT
jgi:hypothetical protein